jgi:hypothetical protein
MPRKLGVCSVINELGILYGHRLEGEIFIKHSAKCKHKTTGTFAWTGAGYQKKGESM